MSNSTANYPFGIVGTRGLSGPRSAYSDGSKLYVADTGNNRVLIWSTLPTTDRQAASIVLGQPSTSGSSANNGGLSGGSMSSPRSAMVNGSHLLVADENNHRVLVWNAIPTASQTSASLALGQPNLTSGTANNGGIGAGTLSSPTSAFSSGTSVYVADSGNNRMLVWNSIPTTNQAAANIAFGQPNLSSSTANATSASGQSLATPHLVSSDGRDFIAADTLNNRV